MARLVLENLTLEQAEEMAQWYIGQGEQDADIWMSENNPKCPCYTTEHPNGKFIRMDGEDVILLLESRE